MRNWPGSQPSACRAYDFSYALNQWERLLCFLDNANIPFDNNASESALRVVALGRKNFPFVGDVEAGDHLAILYSLVPTCEARNIDPVAYLQDVLMRVDTHPASRIDELLPHKWSPPLRWTETSRESAGQFPPSHLPDKLGRALRRQRGDHRTLVGG